MPMEEHYNNDDTFLGRWIAGTLSEEERIAFEKTTAFKQFRIINAEAQNIKGPVINTEAALKKVHQETIRRRKPKRIKLWYASAAIILIIIGLTVVLNARQTYTTGIGEKQTITLADGSIINLNASSRISHKRFFWEANKQIVIWGEAYFKVVKGEGFTVKTSKGDVSVLGTEFNIKDRENLEVKCYEGRIKFMSFDEQRKTYTLTKGMQIGFIDHLADVQGFEENEPSWKRNISKFINQPLSQVLKELTYYYPITINDEAIDTTRMFTGSFIHDNLQNALQTTLVPMGVKYRKAKDSNTIILSN